MSKKKVWAILTVIAIIFCSLITIVIDKYPTNAKSNNIATYAIPTFQLYDMDSNKFNPARYLEKDRVVIIIFDSECEACRWQVQNIFSTPNITTLTLLISPESIERIKSFQKANNYMTTENILFLKGRYPDIFQHFGNYSTPLVLIYEDRQLTKVFNGVVSKKAFSQYLN